VQFEEQEGDWRQWMETKTSEDYTTHLHPRNDAGHLVCPLSTVISTSRRGGVRGCPKCQQRWSEGLIL
jgi:hypothetical protein